jgi:hypothetical protein
VITESGFSDTQNSSRESFTPYFSQGAKIGQPVVCGQYVKSGTDVELKTDVQICGTNELI